MILRVHLLPYFGRMRIDEINNFGIEKYKSKKIGEKLNPKTINNHLTVLRKSLNSAQEWDIIETCPAIKRLKAPPQKYDFLTIEECRKLVNSSDSVWRSMIIVALGTGLRFGELIAITWDDVNLKERELTVKQAFARDCWQPKEQQDTTDPYDRVGLRNVLRDEEAWTRKLCIYGQGRPAIKAGCQHKEAATDMQKGRP